MKRYEQEPVIDKVEELDMNARYTAGQYLQWHFDEMVELIKGRVFKMSPAPRSNHQRIQLSLASLFFTQLQGEKCEAFGAPFDVYLTKNDDYRKAENVVQPDVCIICDPSKIKERGCVGAPDLIVEILSPSTRQKDLTIKRDLYEEFSVPEFWVISVSERFLIRHLLKEEKYHQQIFTEGESLCPANFPNIKVELKKIFEKVPEEI